MENPRTALLVQTQTDADRYLGISPAAKVIVNGNLKFDQSVPESIDDPHLETYFGPGEHPVLLAASTHPGEEALVAASYRELKERFPALKLVLVPRHAERGADIAAMLAEKGLSFCRRSTGELPAEPVDVLLADTTGEMFKFMNAADIVVMGKSLAGHDEGHNLIEPALLAKPIVTGHVLRNFRYLLDALCSADALVAITGDAEVNSLQLVARHYRHAVPQISGEGTLTVKSGMVLMTVPKNGARVMLFS